MKKEIVVLAGRNSGKTLTAQMLKRKLLLEEAEANRIDSITTSTYGKEAVLYMGFVIVCICPPIPIRSCNYHFFPEGDEEGDQGLQGYGATEEECKKQIDELIFDNPTLLKDEQTDKI